MPCERPGLPLLLSQDLQEINLWDTWMLPQGRGAGTPPSGAGTLSPPHCPSLSQKESPVTQNHGNPGVPLEKGENHLTRIHLDKDIVFRASEVTYRSYEQEAGGKLEEKEGRFSWAFLTAHDGRDGASSLLSFIPRDRVSFLIFLKNNFTYFIFGCAGSPLLCMGYSVVAVHRLLITVASLLQSTGSRVHGLQ